MRRWSALALALWLAATPAVAAPGPPVVVSAAVSLANVLQDLGAAWQARTGGRVTINLAASNVLARQIAAGARVDLFISADEAELGVVERAGLVMPGTRVELVGNTLAIAVPADRPRAVTSARALLDPAIRRIAIGDPAGVPAGVYAKRFLEAEGLWAAVQPRIVPAGSVRLALAAVEAGAADAAIVYRSDVGTTSRARLAWVVPAAAGPRIVYVAAVLTAGRQRDGAARFLAFLQTPEAVRMFERGGFLPLPSRAVRP